MRVTERTEGIWLKMLEDLDADALLAAANHLVSTRSDWPPDIATLRGTVIDLAHGYLKKPSGHEAWEHVALKLTESVYPDWDTGKHEIKIELTKLEKHTLKATKEIYELRSSETPSIDRAQFIKAFDDLVARKRLEASVLPEVKQLVEARAKLKQLPPAPNNKSLDKTNDKGAVCKPEEVDEMLSETPNPAELKAMFKGAGLLDG